MYAFYMTVKRLLPIMSTSVQVLSILGVASLLAWAGVIYHVFDPNAEAIIVYLGALPLNLFLPTQAINLFLISMLELFASSILQALSVKMDTYVTRNTYIEKDAQFVVKQKKAPPPIEKTEPHETILALRVPEETALTPLNLEIKRFLKYNARQISSEAGQYLMAFKTLEEAVAYTQFVSLAIQKAGVPANQYALALDYVPVIDDSDADRVSKVWKDSVLLCNLQSQGEVICTEGFLNQWNEKIKPKGFTLIKGKPAALKHSLETTVMGMYLLKGSNTIKTVYTAEIK
jgi:hypothetical protein